MDERRKVGVERSVSSRLRVPDRSSFLAARRLSLSLPSSGSGIGKEIARLHLVPHLWTVCHNFTVPPCSRARFQVRIHVRLCRRRCCCCRRYAPSNQEDFAALLSTPCQQGSQIPSRAQSPVRAAAQARGCLRLHMFEVSNVLTNRFLVSLSWKDSR